MTPRKAADRSTTGPVLSTSALQGLAHEDLVSYLKLTLAVTSSGSDPSLIS